MNKDLDVLFTPWKIGNCEIKNRIVITSMGGTSIFGWMEPKYKKLKKPMTQTSHRLFVWMGKCYFFFLRRKAIPAPIPAATPARPTGRSIRHTLPVEAGSVGSAAGFAVGSDVAAGAGEGLASTSATGIASVSVQPQTVQTRACSPSSLSVGSCVTVQSPKVCAPVSVRSLLKREYFCVCSVSVTVHSGTQPSAWFERSISPYLSPQTSHFARRRQVGVPPVCSPAAGIAVPELSRASQPLQYVSPV